MKPLIIRSVAEVDIAEATQWLDQERSRDVALSFLDAIDTTFRQIREHPRMFAIVEQEFRRAPVAGFAYGVFYIDGPDVISVTAVMHASRDPATWKRRL